MACASIDHLILNGLPFSLRFQMCLDSSVLVLYFSLLKVDLCWLNLFLNVPSVRPM